MTYNDPRLTAVAKETMAAVSGEPQQWLIDRELNAPIEMIAGVRVLRLTRVGDRLWEKVIPTRRALEARLDKEAVEAGSPPPQTIVCAAERVGSFWRDTVEFRGGAEIASALQEKFGGSCYPLSIDSRVIWSCVVNFEKVIEFLRERGA